MMDDEDIERIWRFAIVSSLAVKAELFHSSLHPRVGFDMYVFHPSHEVLSFVNFLFCSRSGRLSETTVPVGNTIFPFAPFNLGECSLSLSIYHGLNNHSIHFVDSCPLDSRC